jgi:hypothetical protein
MPRKPPRPSQPPPNVNVIHLRLDDGLRQRLQQEADRHRFTVTNEIRVRLLDSFDRDLTRGLDEIRLDMEICWRRFGARFLRMELADQLAEAVVKSESQEQIRALAQLIIAHRTAEQRPSSLGSMSREATSDGGAPTVGRSSTKSPATTAARRVTEASRAPSARHRLS